MFIRLYLKSSYTFMWSFIAKASPNWQDKFHKGKDTVRSVSSEARAEWIISLTKCCLNFNRMETQNWGDIMMTVSEAVELCLSGVNPGKSKKRHIGATERHKYDINRRGWISLLWKYLYTEKKIHRRRDKAKALEKIYSPAEMSLKQDEICNAATEPALIRVMDREHKQTLWEEKVPMVTVSGGK